jgi:hypothetical protein
VAAAAHLDKFSGEQQPKAGYLLSALHSQMSVQMQEPNRLAQGIRKDFPCLRCLNWIGKGRGRRVWLFRHRIPQP